VHRPLVLTRDADPGFARDAHREVVVPVAVEVASRERLSEAVARSKSRVIFSPTTEPMLPPMKAKTKAP
jgi:hypothetical protein